MKTNTAAETTQVLLTGFGPFGKNLSNPTSRLVQAVREKAIPGMVARVLPVEFVAGPDRLRELISEYQPRLVLCTGLAAGSQALRVERIAVNERAGTDEAGVAGAIAGQRTRLDAGTGSPDGLFTTLDTDGLVKHLRKSGFTVEESWHAGTFVCNAVLWAGIRSGVPAGFLHVPADVDVPSLAEALTEYFADMTAAGELSDASSVEGA